MATAKKTAAKAPAKAAAVEKTDKPIKLRAVLKWAYLDRVNDLSNAYQVNLTQLTPAAVKALEGLGLEAKHDEEDGFFVVAKSKNYPIEAQLPDGSRLGEGVSVGNGTEAIAIVGAYDWTFKNKSGRSPAIKKLVITNLVEYNAGGDYDDADDVDGVGDIAELESDTL